MKLSIKILDDKDPLWQGVHSLKNYSIYHTKEWKNLVEKTFNHKALYWSVVIDDKLFDVLPFFQIKKFGLGTKLISTPYESCNGSFLSQDSSVHRILIENIIEYGKKSKIKYVEIRSKQPVEILKEFKFEELKPFLHTEVKLNDIDENWNGLSAKHRRNVRYAQNRQNVRIKSASTISEMEVFYKILAQHYKSMGVPFFNKDFFCKIWQKLIENQLAELLITEFKNHIIGGHLLLLSGDTLISKYSAHKLGGKYKKTNASYLSNWSAIEFGIQNNFKYYSMGITGLSNKGLLKFKSSFGGKNNQIYFYYRPLNGKIPDLAKYYDEYPIIKKTWSVLPNFIVSPLGQKINEWIS
jgi:hypothetical protein